MNENCAECNGELTFIESDGAWICLACDALSFLGFCGCGDPEAVTEWLIQELETLRYPQTPSEWFIAYQFDRLNLTDHGVSAGCAFLTEKGKDTLSNLKAGKGKP